MSERQSKPEWELWYQDTFDRGSPRRIEQTGQDLTAGLTALWRHHLMESVGSGSQSGFSRFNLWLTQGQQSIEIAGQRKGLMRLRRWILEDIPENEVCDSVIPEKRLLNQVAETHRRLYVSGRSSAEIPALAGKSSSREEFEVLLGRLKANAKKNAAASADRSGGGDGSPG
jgi:hypothetical protein